MSLTGFNLRRRRLANAKKESVISSVTETKETKVEEPKVEEKPVTETKPVHKKTGKK